MNKRLKFYIKERHNPQKKTPYYVAEGQLTKKNAMAKEKSVYGMNIMLVYENEEEYKKAISDLKHNGKNVY